MKKYYLFLLTFLISVISYADTGYGYRLHVDIELKNSEIKTGYIYVYSWNKYETYGNLKEFLNSNVPNKKLLVYPNITNVSMGDFILDFAIEGSYKIVELKNINQIKKEEILSFSGGTYRLYELSKEEYNLIQTKKPFYKGINIYDIAEYCQLTFLCWEDDIKKGLIDKVLTDLRNYKMNKLNNNLEGHNGTKFYEYLDTIKTSLLEKNIILIQYCESC